MTIKTLYYDALFTVLIPVQLIERGYPCRVKVKRTTGAYKAKEIIDVYPRDLVNKTGVRDGFIMIRTANLDDYEVNNDN